MMAPIGGMFYRNGYLLWLTILMLLVAGISGLNSLPRLEDPRITNRNPLVVTTFPGADAERVEGLVTKKLEEVLQEIAEIHEVKSTSRQGVSIIAIELADSITSATNEAVFSKIRDKLSAVPLPPGVHTPQFDDLRGAVAYTMIVAFRWEFDGPAPLGILDRLSENLADHLRNVPGTEIVRTYGEPHEEMLVRLHPEQAVALGLDPREVAARIQAADAKQPAGLIRGQARDLGIEVAGELDAMDRILQIPVQTSSSNTLTRVGDIAEVQRQWKTPPEEIGLVDGYRGVFVAARMKPGYRVDHWSAHVEVIVQNFRKRLGAGIALETVFIQDAYTSERLRALVSNLLAGAGVIVLVILVLMGGRSALIVGSALPLVSGLTLFLILIGGGSLHQMSIFGMIIALGLLIDNAIVVVDEVQQRRTAGIQGSQAVQATLNHLAAPLFASTLTTLFAFAPILLLPGNIGDFVGSIGGSVVLAVGSSFFLALTVIAALAGRYLVPRNTTACANASVGAEANRRRHWWRYGLKGEGIETNYRKILMFAFKRPAWAALVAVSPAVMGFLLASELGSQFFPRVDRNMFQAQVWLPSTTSVAQTEKMAKRIETVVRRHPEIEHVYWLIGGSAPSVYYNLIMNKDQSHHYAQAILVTQDKAQVKSLIRDLQEELDQQFPEAQIVVNQFAQGPPVEAPVEFRIYGPALSTLQNLGERVRRRLQEHPQVLHCQTSMQRGEPKVIVRAREEETRLVGLEPADIAKQLQGNTEGYTGGSILEGVEELPVRVRWADDQRESLRELASTNLVSQGSDWIPLGVLGDLWLTPESQGITRKDGLRCNIISGYVTNEALPIEVAEFVRQQVQSKVDELPGYRLEAGGDAEEDGQAIRSLQNYLPILLTLTLATLILAFGNVLLAGLLGTIGLLSIGLGLGSTWVFGFPISFNTILGTLGLVGVALNDSIVVLAAIRANPRARIGDRLAMVSEVNGCTRHVVATTLTTAGGFIPLIIAGGDFWPPLAVVLAGGVFGATLLALLYIPATYLLLQRLQRGWHPAGADAASTSTT